MRRELVALRQGGADGRVRCPLRGAGAHQRQVRGAVGVDRRGACWFEQIDDQTESEHGALIEVQLGLFGGVIRCTSTKPQ